MTIQEFCKQRRISKPTIYKKIHAAGLDLGALRDADGNLTPEAITTLAALTDDITVKYSKRVNDDPETVAIDAAENPVNYAKLIAERDALRRDLDDLRAQLNQANARIMALQAEALERERAHADAWKLFSERQQELEAQKLLTAEASADGRTVWQRLRAKFGRKD